MNHEPSIKHQQMLKEIAHEDIPSSALSALSMIRIGLQSLEHSTPTPALRKILQKFGAEANFLAARPTEAQMD